MELRMAHSEVCGAKQNSWYRAKVQVLYVLVPTGLRDSTRIYVVRTVLDAGTIGPAYPRASWAF
jgi:hypothetical protein